MDKKQILEKLKHIHPSLDILELKNSKYVKVRDEYGECVVQLHSLLGGSKPSISTALNKTEYFKSKLKKCQPDVELLSDYKGANSKIKIKTKYGECLCISSAILRGSPISIDVAVNKTEYYINKAKEKHGNKYDYSKLVYINNEHKLKIICKRHGEFEQEPNTHLRTKGCKKCADEEKSGGWYNNHINSNKITTMYIIRIYNEEEDFLKYGITVNINQRIQNIINNTNKKYKIKIIKIINGTAEYCSRLEQRFKRKIDKNSCVYTKYLPKISFQGKYECFQINKNN